MCLAMPAKVIAVDAGSDSATVMLGEIKKEISLALVEGVVPGDYVLLHVGYALNRISPEEAAKTLQLFHEAGFETGEIPVSGNPLP